MKANIIAKCFTMSDGPNFCSNVYLSIPDRVGKASFLIAHIKTGCSGIKSLQPGTFSNSARFQFGSLVSFVSIYFV